MGTGKRTNLRVRRLLKQSLGSLGQITAPLCWGRLGCARRLLGIILCQVVARPAVGRHPRGMERTSGDRGAHRPTHLARVHWGQGVRCGARGVALKEEACTRVRKGAGKGTRAATQLMRKRADRTARVTSKDRAGRIGRLSYSSLHPVTWESDKMASLAHVRWSDGRGCERGMRGSVPRASWASWKARSSMGSNGLGSADIDRIPAP